MVTAQERAMKWPAKPTKIMVANAQQLGAWLNDDRHKWRLMPQSWRDCVDVFVSEYNGFDGLWME